MSANLSQLILNPNLLNHTLAACQDKNLFTAGLDRARAEAAAEGGWEEGGHRAAIAGGDDDDLEVDCGGITDGSLDARFQFVSLAPAPTKSAAMKTRIVSKVGIDPFMGLTPLQSVEDAKLNGVNLIFSVY